MRRGNETVGLWVLNGFRRQLRHPELVSGPRLSQNYGKGTIFTRTVDLVHSCRKSEPPISLTVRSIPYDANEDQVYLSKNTDLDLKPLLNIKIVVCT